MHVVYICCFYGNPLFMGMRWQDFHHEFISQLMRFVANNIERELFIDVSDCNMKTEDEKC